MHCTAPGPPHIFIVGIQAPVTFECCRLFYLYIFCSCRLLAWFWAWWLFLAAVEPSLLQSRYQWLGLNFYFPTQVPFGLLPQPADAPHCRSTCHCSLALSPGQVPSQLQCDRGLCSRTHLNTWYKMVNCDIVTIAKWCLWQQSLWSYDDDHYIVDDENDIVEMVWADLGMQVLPDIPASWSCTPVSLYVTPPYTDVEHGLWWSMIIMIISIVMAIDLPLSPDTSHPLWYSTMASPLVDQLCWQL